MSTLLGFYLGLHDSNVSIAADGVVKYVKSERITGIKHHKADINFVRFMCQKWGIKSVDAVAFSDGNRNGLGACKPGELWSQVEPIKDLFNVPTFCIDHHYCHILSAWPLSRLKDIDIGVVIDGRGDHDIRRTVISDPSSIRSQYIYYDKAPSMGNLLESIGYCMNLAAQPEFDVDLAGKIMGAHAYGNIQKNFVDSINISEIGTNYRDLFYSIPWEGKVPTATKDFFDFNNQNFKDWLSSVHKIVELETLHFFQKYTKPTDTIIYSGGCAQNVVCNNVLINNFPNLIIPPHSYDGGLSLGTIEFLRLLLNDSEFQRDGFPYWQNDIEDEAPSLRIIKQTAKQLAEGKIIGWFQGQGAIGPRALGNRSILMNPASTNGKDMLNSRVKHRESWRPYGASISNKYTSEWFNIDQESPFMLRSVQVNEDRKKNIPSVTHVDGTCRIQTVSHNDNMIFAELIDEFNLITGIPLLLNTSLNGGGQPIFASKEQCYNLLKTTDLDGIVIGNQIIH